MSDIPSQHYELTPLVDEAGLAEVRRELPEAAQVFLRDFRERHANRQPFTLGYQRKIDRNTLAKDYDTSVDSDRYRGISR